MGNMHVIPTEADLRTDDEKCEPLRDFKPIDETSPLWEHGAKFCNGCCEPFDVVFVRKHHCRICGLAYCTRCGPKRYVLCGSRGCGKCTSRIILDMKDMMLAEHQKVARQHQHWEETHHPHGHPHPHPESESMASPASATTTPTTTPQLPPPAPSATEPKAAEDGDDAKVPLHRVESDNISEVSVESPVHHERRHRASSDSAEVPAASPAPQHSSSPK